MLGTPSDRHNLPMTIWLLSASGHLSAVDIDGHGMKVNEDIITPMDTLCACKYQRSMRSFGAISACLD